MSSSLTKIGYTAGSLLVFYVIFFLLTPWVFKDLTEHRKKSSTKTFSDKKSIDLVKGVCEFGNSNKLNTSNKFKSNYIELPTSVNRAGGIEFSYSFWAKLGDLKKDNVIFIKGTNPKDNGLTAKFSEIYDETGKKTSDNKHLLRCPMVKISKDFITISFNTSRKINNEVKFEVDKNKFLLSSEENPRWFMFSICFREGDFTTDYGLKTKGVILNMYLNEQHIKTHFVENDSLRLNNSDIFIFPDSDSALERGSQAGNFVYHNFSLDNLDVARLWASGLDTSGCAVAAKAEESDIKKNIQINKLGKSGAQFLI